jgi:putative nucleotidyltransferase with HDIG domain
MVVHITDAAGGAIDLGHAFGGSRHVRRASIDDLANAGALDDAPLVIDADLADPEVVRKLRAHLPAKKHGATWIFVCDDIRVSEVQAAALGATHVVTRPLDVGQLEQCLTGAHPAFGLDEANAASAVSSIQAGGAALDGLFTSVLANKPFAAAAVTEVAETITSALDQAGVNEWLSLVRHHHSGTYQHCLLVTGVATAFARKLGLSSNDRTAITFAGLVHDIGKARIPVAVLDKPGKLTQQELALMRLHPLFGHELLARATDLRQDVVDAARHHHEYLDGSGYPDGLAGARIGDVTRILTISDVFGALLERRSYKPPMPAKQAYEFLAQMADRGLLELPLVNAFRRVADDIA